jgi:mannosyltransferase OCH1-like enzyme
MINKTVHFIWLGEHEKPKQIKACFNSWMANLKEYKFQEWSLDNIPRDIFFVEKMIELKQWAFASDYLRLHILYNYGGIYLDTDMLVYKSFDPLLGTNFFIGQESDLTISAGIIGSVKNHYIIQECLNFYSFYNNPENFSLFLNNKITIPSIFTQVINACLVTENRNIQSIGNINIYPPEYFYPVKFSERSAVSSFIPSNQNTYTLHLWEASWHNEFQNLSHGKILKSLSMFFVQIREIKTDKFDYFLEYFKFFLKTILKLIFIKPSNKRSLI